MLVKITRGIGGPKGLLLLALTAAVGVLLLFGAIRLRHHLLAPKGVLTTTVPPAEVLALGDKARGASPQLVFVAGEFARVTSYAVARRADNPWEGLAENSILRVTGSTAVGGETWVAGTVEGDKRLEIVTVHASFLDRYKPVTLDNLVELSDVRLLTVRAGPSPGTAVIGWVRNTSGRTISQVVVTCVFQDRQEHDVDTRRSAILQLPPGELVRFQTLRSEVAFAGIAVQIMYATPEGLRNYLPTVVIQKSSLQ